MSPEGSDLVLTTDIPDVELDILVGHALDVESDGRNGSNILVAEFKFVENSWEGEMSANSCPEGLN